MLKQGVIVLLSAAVVYWITGLAVKLGVFRPVFNHSPGKCFHLEGIEDGSEDIQALPNGLAFISSGINIKQNSKGTGPVGKIYLFDFNHPKKSPVELKIVGDEKYKTMNPHGISLWTDPKTGDSYLYVVNHTPTGDAVDKFRIHGDKKTLEHIRRIENEPDMSSVNDLVVVDEDQFYYSNDKYFSVNTEIAFNLHWGSVGFFNGKNAVLVETGLFLPNGIAVSKDQKSIYLSNIGHEEIKVYQKNADNSLTSRQSISLKGTLPDNIDVDQETGDLWIGAHPSMIKFVKHMQNVKENKTPSQVLRIRNPDSSSPEVIEVYSDDGVQLSGSSVAVRFGKSMLVGSVFDRTLYCQLSCA